MPEVTRAESCMASAHAEATGSPLLCTISIACAWPACTLSALDTAWESPLSCDPAMCLGILLGLHAAMSCTACAIADSLATQSRSMLCAAGYHTSSCAPRSFLAQNPADLLRPLGLNRGRAQLPAVAQERARLHAHLPRV